MKRLFLITFMALFGLAITACGAGKSNKPEDVALKYVELMYDGKAEEAFSYIYIPEKDLKEAGVKELVTGKLKQGSAKAQEEAEEHGGIKNLAVENSEIEGNHGTVKVKTEFEDESSRMNTVKIMQIEDDWKVSF